MKQEHFTDKVIKRFYGMTGPFDEYKQRETEYLGNRSFVFLFWSLVPTSLLAYIAGIQFPTITALVFPIFVILLCSGAYLRVLFKLQKEKLTETDLEEWTPAERTSLKHAGLKAGTLYAMAMIFFMSLLSYALNGSIFAFLKNGRALAILGVTSLIFAIIIHFSAKKINPKSEE